MDVKAIKHTMLQCRALKQTIFGGLVPDSQAFRLYIYICWLSPGADAAPVYDRTVPSINASNKLIQNIS